MNTLKLTAEHFKQSNSYWKDYIGTEDVSDYDGNIEIGSNLGYIKFDCIKTENLSLEVGSYLKVGGYLEVGDSLEVGSYLKVGGSLKVGSSLEVGSYLEVGGSLEVGSYLEVGDSLEVGSYLKVGDYLEVGGSLEVGSYLKVGGFLEVKYGISVALWISVKGKMTWSLRCFAGICRWRDIDDSEKTITCGKKEGTGVVEYGILVETGLPDEKLEGTMVVQDIAEDNTITVLGKKYKLTPIE